MRGKQHSRPPVSTAALTWCTCHLVWQKRVTRWCQPVHSGAETVEGLCAEGGFIWNINQFFPGGFDNPDLVIIDVDVSHVSTHSDPGPKSGLPPRRRTKRSRSESEATLMHLAGDLQSFCSPHLKLLGVAQD